MPTMPAHTELVSLVIERLQHILGTRDLPHPPDLGEHTVLIGAPQAILDSLGWVLFVVDLEQELEERFGNGAAFASEVEAAEIGEAETVGSITARIERSYSGV